MGFNTIKDIQIEMQQVLDTAGEKDFRGSFVVGRCGGFAVSVQEYFKTPCPPQRTNRIGGWSSDLKSVYQ